MKIAYVSKSVIPSRSANSIQVMKMCSALAKCGNSVVLLVPDRRSEKEKGAGDFYRFYDVENCFEIHQLPCIDPRGSRALFSAFSIWFAVVLWRKIVSLKPDVVYSRDIVGGMIGCMMRFKTIFESHYPIRSGGLKPVFFQNMYKSRYFEKLTVISASLKNRYLEDYGIASQKVQVLPDAADEPRSTESIEQWPGRKDALQVGYVGHLYPGKGIEVIERLCKVIPQIDFHIVGGTEADILKWRKRTNSGNLFFHGHVPPNRISKYINRLNVCLLPNQKQVHTHESVRKSGLNISDYSSPLKLFEYMAHGKAIVASDFPVLREVLNEKNAILVRCDDVEQWKSAILALEDEGLRTSLGSSAYHDFQARYTWRIRAQNALS